MLAAAHSLDMKLGGEGGGNGDGRGRIGLLHCVLAVLAAAASVYLVFVTLPGGHRR